MSLLNRLNLSTSLLLAGALFGGLLGAACDPKTIGDETAGNLVCKQGETKPAGDGCNTCSCVNGDWACTEIACGECQDGETKPAGDGCNTCGCVDGMWACTLIGCNSTDGPVCNDGDMMPAGDGCNTCTCQGGIWACTEIGCGGSTSGGSTSGGDTSTGGQNGGCGDGALDPGEQCDDGNETPGDGCDSFCQLEDGDKIMICQEPYPLDALTIKNAVLVGDAIQVDVEYGGGCQTHEFAYCWAGLFLESFPVQVMTQISHDANGDPCDAFFSETQTFDLTPLKTEYQKGYQTPNGEIAIHLAGWQGGPLLYSF